ncbi:MAG: hypothetical protein ACT6Q7_18550 [Blastomonas fulva]|uniref:hypothetical protein n=1 Tax=Blastomonas fulva TaxID=1550728 RepID=UPI0040338EF3
MDAHRFHRWNVLSGVLWVSLVLTPGFLAGRGIEIAGGGMAWHGMARRDHLAAAAGKLLADRCRADGRPHQETF